MAPARRGGLLLCFDLLERLAGDAERVDPARDAGIDRDLGHHLADLVLGHAVPERALDMQLQFVRAIEDADHGDVEHAAGLAREAVAAPGGAPAIFSDELLERTIEIVRAS